MTARRPRSSAALDERAFHAWLARTLPSGRRGLLPLGDDAAAVLAPEGQVAVVSTDALVEGTHFLPASRPETIGHAAVAVSLSDVAAKGARPAAVLLAVIVPRGTPEAWAERLTEGAERTAAEFGAHVVGGDTKPGPVPTVVSTVLGWAGRDELVRRTGARAGDLLLTTGSVGRGGAVAAELGRQGPVPIARAASLLLDVRPRVREGIALAPYAHAMLDTSDGFAESARLLAAASRVRVVVEEERLPLAPRLRSLAPSRRRALAFYGGDYELLTAVPPRRVASAVRAVRAVGGRLTQVGAIERGRGAVLVSRAGPIPMPPAGWQPFARGGARLPLAIPARSVSDPRRVHGMLK